MSRGLEQTRADARRLRDDEGLSFSEIAARLGINKSSAHEYCNEEYHSRANARRAKRQRTAAVLHAELDALRSQIEAEVERLREKGRRNAALIHYAQADRLQAILDSTGAEEEGR